MVATDVLRVTDRPSTWLFTPSYLDVQEEIRDLLEEPSWSSQAFRFCWF